MIKTIAIPVAYVGTGTEQLAPLANLLQKQLGIPVCRRLGMVVYGYADIVFLGQLFHNVPHLNGRFAGDVFHAHILGQAEHLFPFLGLVAHKHAASHNAHALFRSKGEKFLARGLIQVIAEGLVAPFSANLMAGEHLHVGYSQFLSLVKSLQQSEFVEGIALQGQFPSILPGLLACTGGQSQTKQQHAQRCLHQHFITFLHLIHYYILSIVSLIL